MLGEGSGRNYGIFEKGAGSSRQNGKINLAVKGYEKHSQ